MVISRIMTGQRNVIWPSFVKGIRNWIQANLIVRPNFDRNFNLTDFVDGARQAFVTVSDKIASGNVSSLKGLVTDEVLASVNKSLLGMSATDRALFRRSESDVYMSFPYQLGIVMDDADATKRWVEVMVVYHTLQGFEKLQEKNISVTDMQKDDVSKLFMFANFRFSRNYSKGLPPGQSEWIINYLNYFTPESDHEEAKKERLG